MFEQYLTMYIPFDTKITNHYISYTGDCTITDTFSLLDFDNSRNLFYKALHLKNNSTCRINIGQIIKDLNTNTASIISIWFYVPKKDTINNNFSFYISSEDFDNVNNFTYHSLPFNDNNMIINIMPNKSSIYGIINYNFSNNFNCWNNLILEYLGQSSDNAYCIGTYLNNTQIESVYNGRRIIGNRDRLLFILDHIFNISIGNTDSSEIYIGSFAIYQKVPSSLFNINNFNCKSELFSYKNNNYISINSYKHYYADSKYNTNRTIIWNKKVNYVILDPNIYKKKLFITSNL